MASLGRSYEGPRREMSRGKDIEKDQHGIEGILRSVLDLKFVSLSLFSLQASEGEILSMKV